MKKKIYQRGISIQSYLRDGLTIKTVGFSSISAYCCPRSRVSALNNYYKEEGASIYFLFGTDPNSSEPTVYIGESNNILRRIKEHCKKKQDEWDHIYIFSSSTSKPLNTVYAQYLEYCAYTTARKLGRYKVMNQVSPSKPTLPKETKDILHDFFDEVKLILNESGHPLLISLVTEPDDIFYANRNEIKARGKMTKQGKFILLKGSQVTSSFNRSMYHSNIEIHQMLIEEGILKLCGDHYILTKDYAFETPSTAYQVFIGRVGSGWQGWKNKAGETLAEYMGNDFE